MHTRYPTPFVKQHERKPRRTMVRVVGGILEQTFDDGDAAVREHALWRHDDTRFEIALELRLKMMPAACHAFP